MGSIGNYYEQPRARPADNGRIERHPSGRSVPRTNPTNPAPRGTHYGVTPIPGTRNRPVQRLNDSCADSTLMTARATTSMRLRPLGRRLWVSRFGPRLMQSATYNACRAATTRPNYRSAPLSSRAGFLQQVHDRRVPPSGRQFQRGQPGGTGVRATGRRCPYLC